MPIPVHIICSQSGSDDKSTGLVSAYHIFEKIQLGPIPQSALPLVQMRIATTWMRETRDIDKNFEFETRIFLPGAENVFETGRGTFLFIKEFQRLTSLIWGPLPITEPGIMTIENRIRIVGEEDWVAQRCPVLIERSEQAASDAAAPNN